MDIRQKRVLVEGIVDHLIEHGPIPDKYRDIAIEEGMQSLSDFKVMGMKVEKDLAELEKLKNGHDICASSGINYGRK